MFRPTCITELFSSVNAKSKGYTVSGPTCFFPMMPEGGHERSLSGVHLPEYGCCARAEALAWFLGRVLREDYMSCG